MPPCGLPSLTTTGSSMHLGKRVAKLLVSQYSLLLDGNKKDAGVAVCTA